MKPNLNKVYYTYNDISIIPSRISSIEHRSDTNPFTSDGNLPIFTAPMSSVVNEKNFKTFSDNKITPILPRNINFSKRMEYALTSRWAAFSLNEFEKYFCDEISTFADTKNIKVLVDIANGHMKKLFELVEKSKKIFGDRILIMIGNIANPQTYIDACNCGADYVRLGIGSGMGCITSSNTAIHMPMATLIADTYETKRRLSIDRKISFDSLPKIVADGGVRNYSDIIKALVLGADYVMVGGVLAKALESAGDITIHMINPFKEEKETIFTHINSDEIHYNNEERRFYFRGAPIKRMTKVFYGMASIKGQEDLYGKKIKTSEGLVKEVDVEYDIKGWSENLTDFLRSAMSYTNSCVLKDLPEAETIFVTTNAFNAINR